MNTDIKFITKIKKVI